VVADDESRDGTQEIVRRAAGRADLPPGSGVVLLERRGAEHRGLTASVLDGIRAADAEFFTVMDGDLQHPPEVIGDLMAEIWRGADFAVAARVPYRENQGAHRILMTRLSKHLARLRLRCCGMRLSDPLSGLFAGRRALALEIIDASPSRFEPRGYKVLFDLLKAAPAGVKAAEVFYQFGVRPGGHSKLRPRHAFYFLRSLFR